MASTLAACGLIPSVETTCPKNFTDFWNHLALDSFNCILCSANRSMSCRRCSSCSSTVLLNTSKSSIKIFTNLRSRQMSAIVCINTLGAFVNPMGNAFHSKLPCGVTIAVFGMSSSAKGSCQNPQMASNALKTFAPCNSSNIWSTLGNGYRFLTVNLLRAR